ncbi:MAG: hypothetical protein HPY59_08735 [Anaerolineae bacterium]|nr:hypothetical protein [Anaerolineae bacterium]
MKTVLRLAVWLYGGSLRFYPPSFRAEFGQEMLLVFAQAAAHSLLRGALPFLALCLREVLSFPAILLSLWQESASHFIRESDQGRLFNGSSEPGRGWMSQSVELDRKAAWSRRSALLAALPPLVFGLGLSLAWGVIGPHWVVAPPGRLMAGVSLGFLAALVIAGGALFALLRRLPDWGYTWVGAALLGGMLFLQVFAEEWVEQGLYHIPPFVDALVNSAVLLSFLTFLGWAAWRGWRQAGLLSFGLATTLALAFFHGLAVPPINRPDLATLAAGLGLAFSLLIYGYARGSTWLPVVALFVAGALSLGMVWVTGKLWANSAAGGAAPSLAAFGIFVAGLLLAGPLLGLLSRPLRRALHRI